MTGYAHLIQKEINNSLWDNRLNIEKKLINREKAMNCQNFSVAMPNQSYNTAHDALQVLEQIKYIRAYDLTYPEFPNYYTWKKKKWIRKQKKENLHIRLYNAYPGTRRFFIRTLLLHMKGNFFGKNKIICMRC